MTGFEGSQRGRAAKAIVVLAVALAAAGLVDARLARDAAAAPRWLVADGSVVTSFGSSGYMFALSALAAAAALAIRRGGPTRWRGVSLQLVAERALFFFAAIAVSGIAAQIVKHLVGRSRPRLIAVDGAFHFDPVSLGAQLASFPSGHTTSAFAAAVALGMMALRWRALLLSAAALIGVSRVLVGAHYPSDVVAGAALGSLVTLGLAGGFARRGIAFTMSRGRPVLEPLRRAPARQDARA